MRILAAADFGAVARQRRRDLGLSQQALAQRTGVTRQWLVRFEKGNTDVALSKAFTVLSELGLLIRADDPQLATSRDSPARFTIPKADVAALQLDGLTGGLEVVREAIERLKAHPGAQDD